MMVWETTLSLSRSSKLCCACVTGTDGFSLMPYALQDLDSGSSVVITGVVPTEDATKQPLKVRFNVSRFFLLGQQIAICMESTSSEQESFRFSYQSLVVRCKQSVRSETTAAHKNVRFISMREIRGKPHGVVDFQGLDKKNFL